MALQSQAEPLLTLFSLQKNPNSKAKKDSPLSSHTKATPEIRELAFHFVALIGKLSRYDLCGRNGGFGTKESDCPIYPPFAGQATKKALICDFNKKTSKF